MILGNIGDISGIPELPVLKEARKLAAGAFNASTNSNGYPPYPGLIQLRQAVVADLMSRLGFAHQDTDALVEAGVLLPGEELFELVAISAGSVGCSGAICSHVKYHTVQRRRAAASAQSHQARDAPVGIALDRTHYWKHQGVAEDFGEVRIYDFTAFRDGGLHLDAAAVERFGRDGGGVMVLNFANPLCFLPSAEEAHGFVSRIAAWNSASAAQEITVCVDGPYDDFDGVEGCRFVGMLLEAGVTTTYIHPRTKEEFATGSRGGEVFCNNPVVRQLFNAYKADYIGSDSKLEQEIALQLRDAPSLEQEKRRCMSLIRERKELFWSLLEQHPELEQVRRDTAAFYRPDGPFYVYVNLQSVIGQGQGGYADSMEVCAALARQGVILLPGTLFDSNPDAATGLNRVGVRVSFGSFGSESWRGEIAALVGALARLVAGSRHES